jgi:hypothetical protein
MQPSNQLLKPVIMLALGFALGLGAANYYFAAAGNEDKASAAAPPPPATAKAPEAYVLSAAPNAPIKLAANLGPLTKDSAGINALSEDISLSETVDAGRQETAATEPSPEALARNPPIDRAAAPQLSSQEIDNLENKLRESENTAPIPGNEGLLGHERL